MGSRGAAPAEHPLASFDREMEAFMQARDIPGGALAIARQGKVIYSRGYGLADRERKTAVAADSLFRLASVSKPITALAILRLVQSGKLRLDEQAFKRLALDPLPGKKSDPRLERITIRQLLQHTGGWDRDRSGDPMFLSDRIARASGVSRPPDARAIIRYLLGQPLDFDPGTRHVYSNFGYCVLGRIIEQVTGKSYEEWVRTDLFEPIGNKSMRLGRSLEHQAAPGEVRYYTADDRRGSCVFDGVRGRVPVPYGGFCLEAMDAHGGWIASAPDPMRLVLAMDRAVEPLLTPEFFQQMTSPPAAPVARQDDGTVADAYYGCGWMVRPMTGPAGFNLWHTGSLPGTFTLLVRLASGTSWAALFNQRRQKKGLPDGEIGGALHRAVRAVKEWPD